MFAENNCAEAVLKTQRCLSRGYRLLSNVNNSSRLLVSLSRYSSKCLSKVLSELLLMHEILTQFSLQIAIFLTYHIESVSAWPH